MPADRLYILLPVHNRLLHTQRFIRSLLAQDQSEYHLLLLDDGSSDGTSDWVSANLSSVTVLRGSGNWWWAGAIHAGFCWLKAANISDSALVLIINDDTEFEPDFLTKAKVVMNLHPNSLILAQSFDRKTGNLLDRGTHVDWKKLTFRSVENPEQINVLASRGLFLHWGNFKKIGSFKSGLLPHYCSDYEFTIRAKRKGFALRSSPDVRLKSDAQATGSHDLQKIFSRRSAQNPITLSIFVLLSCPWPWKLPNLIRIWKRVVISPSS